MTEIEERELRLAKFNVRMMIVREVPAGPCRVAAILSPMHREEDRRYGCREDAGDGSDRRRWDVRAVSRRQRR